MTSTDTWHSRTTVRATPDHVIEALTDPAAVARWSPIPFALDDPDVVRLQAGTTTHVSGRLMGAPVHFELMTLAASPRRLRLHARGPIDIHVDYTLTPIPAGCALEAVLAIPAPAGTHGRILAGATRLLLASGTLDHAVKRIAREAELGIRGPRSAA